MRKWDHIIYSTSNTDDLVEKDLESKRIYSSWFRNQVWKGQFDFVMRSVNIDDLKNGNQKQPIRNELMFDKCEDQTYSNNNVVGVSALVMYHYREMNINELKAIIFRVANCYRNLFSIELIQIKIQELIHSNIIKYYDDKLKIYKKDQLFDLIDLCIPFLSKYIS